MRLAICLVALLAATAARAGESPLAFLLEQGTHSQIKALLHHGRIDKQAYAYSIIVRASYYGGGRGERLSAYTATGERFNPNGLTAAHRSLPFGTRLEVTNMANGRVVVVRVNDRGPAASTGRALDLARGAATRLGFIGAGEARVSYRVVN